MRNTHDLTTTIPGGVLLPGDPAYTEATSTLAGEGRPDLVVRPHTSVDVAAAVRLARQEGLPLTVRAGGHSMAGLSTPTEGLLLDLRPLDDIVVEPGTRLVRIGGGARWGSVVRALQPHGLGLTAGDTASVGVGGLTLGGGIGWMVRLHGLAIDHLVGAEVVTADGSILEVSEEQHPELFWALRGGGGNFGVVTRFDFVAQPVTDVVFGTMTFALDDPTALLAGWRDAQRAADERLTTVLTLMPTMGEQPAAAVLRLCFAGDETEAAPAIADLLALGTVVSSDVSARPYADVLEDAHRPAGMRISMRNTFVPTLDDEVLGDLADLFAAGSVLSLRGMGGAVSRVPADATAFAHRSAEAMLVAIRVSGPDAPGATDIPGWSQVARHGTGSYVNFMSTATETDTLDGYPGSALRQLRQVKATYDPDNLFRNTVNIRPEESAA